MKYLILMSLILSHSAFAAGPAPDQAKFEAECYKGSNTAGIWPDMARDLQAEEEACVDAKLKGKPAVQPKSVEEAKKLFAGECNKTPNKSSLYPDMAIEVREQEEACVDNKMKDYLASQKNLAPSKERCQHEEGVAFHCPEGVYKFQGASDLDKINDSLNRDAKDARPSSKAIKAKSLNAKQH
jgi:hypothetical protein